jgi:DinB superfamily
MSHNLDETLSLLARTPAALNALLRDQPEIWTLRNEGPNTWNAVEIVGHLISGERTDWVPRARMIMQFGDSKAFEPFDMKGHVREIDGKSMNQLLDEFAQLRTNNLIELRAWKLQPADLERRGVHPSLGTVTMSQLLATWPAHDMTHLHQLSRVLAHQYRETVGSWSEYMGVLQCSGHSSE